MKIEIERDVDCRMATFYSEDGSAIAWLHPVHFSSLQKEFDDNILFEITIPDSVLRFIKENVNWIK